jgi:carbon storage regulator
MIVISRKPGEAICIADDIRIVVLKASSGRITRGIEAPQDVRVLREEIREPKNYAVTEATTGDNHDKTSYGPELALVHELRGFARTRTLTRSGYGPAWKNLSHLRCRDTRP